MVLSPYTICPSTAVAETRIPELSPDIFPELSSEAPDCSPDEDVNSPRRIAARAALEQLQAASVTQVAIDKELPLDTGFSDKHEVFNAHLATRSLSAPAGAVVIGGVHKYPTLNVLIKGKVLMVSEHGKRLLVAPCTYMQAANVKKAGWVLEDCTLMNVFMTPEAPTSLEDADRYQREFHTTPNYSGVGLDTAAQLEDGSI